MAGCGLGVALERRPSPRSRCRRAPGSTAGTSTRPPSAPGSANQRGISRAPPRCRTRVVRRAAGGTPRAVVDGERVLELHVPDAVARAAGRRPRGRAPRRSARRCRRRGRRRRDRSGRAGRRGPPARRSADRKSTCRAVGRRARAVARPTAVPAGGEPVERVVVQRVDVPGGRRGPDGEHGAAELGEAPRRTTRAFCTISGTSSGDERGQRRGQVLHRPLLRVARPAGDGVDRALVEEVPEAGERAEVGGQLLRVAQRLPPAGSRRELHALEPGDRDRLERPLVLLAADEVVELGLPLVDRVAPI